MANSDVQMSGASPAFFDLMDQISQAAPMDRPVLVIGERGTGKELIAARLHYLSQRWDQDFLKLNCAALPETLLESELFGVEPGAFTGATKRRHGRFERADGGTLFLDEIATMSAAAQEKLLRVSEYGEFERVGGSETLTTDARLVGATNIDLPSAADAGAFRHDLLDRLAFDVITVPPLRARREDILVLAETFARAMAAELEWLVFPGFSPEATDMLMDHDWPGNVRELKNTVERAVYRAWDGERPIDTLILDPFDSPYRPKAFVPKAPAGKDGTTDLPTKGQSIRGNLKEAVAAFEKAQINGALDANNHNQRKAAMALGLSYDQLRHAARKHGLI